MTIVLEGAALLAALCFFFVAVMMIAGSIIARQRL
jgi:hypothetical protein